MDAASATFLYSWDADGGSLPPTTLILLAYGPISSLQTFRRPQESGDGLGRLKLFL